MFNYKYNLMENKTPLIYDVPNKTKKHWIYMLCANWWHEFKISPLMYLSSHYDQNIKKGDVIFIYHRAPNAGFVCVCRASSDQILNQEPDQPTVNKIKIFSDFGLNKFIFSIDYKIVYENPIQLSTVFSAVPTLKQKFKSYISFRNSYMSSGDELFNTFNINSCGRFFVDILYDIDRKVKPKQYTLEELNSNLVLSTSSSSCLSEEEESVYDLYSSCQFSDEEYQEYLSNSSYDSDDDSELLFENIRKILNKKCQFILNYSSDYSDDEDMALVNISRKFNHICQFFDEIINTSTNSPSTCSTNTESTIEDDKPKKRGRKKSNKPKLPVVKKERKTKKTKKIESPQSQTEICGTTEYDSSEDKEKEKEAPEEKLDESGQIPILLIPCDEHKDEYTSENFITLFKTCINCSKNDNNELNILTILDEATIEIHDVTEDGDPYFEPALEAYYNLENYPPLDAESFPYIRVCSIQNEHDTYQDCLLICWQCE